MCRVSRSLVFDAQPITQPRAKDPVERATWSSLRISVGSRPAGTVWDPKTGATRNVLHVPVFAVAEWLAANWWSIFHESCRHESVPLDPRTQADLDWCGRHCLRTADSSLLLPRLYLYHDGMSLRAKWLADTTGDRPSDIPSFVSSGDDALAPPETISSVRDFVDDVLGRVEILDDERVVWVQKRWRAIREADDSEREFCEFAGRLGVDPYDADEMSDDLATFLEVLSSKDPLATDLTEAVTPDRVSEQWRWADTSRFELGLGPASAAITGTTLGEGNTPAVYGYQLASICRGRLPAKAGYEPIANIEDAATAVCDQRFLSTSRNHLPGRGVQSIVGQDPAKQIVAAGPFSAKPTARRFALARALYHSLVTATSGPRLVTSARTWHQSASRAFAAEFLAPKEALVSLLESDEFDSEDLTKLADRFAVDSQVVRHQLENAGLYLRME
jgi:hypothetical protein